MAVFADWVCAYNTRRPHSALAGRTPLELWRSDPTPVRALGHEQARWMLLARGARVVGKDGIHHNGKVYFADELWGMVGEEVEVAHMPHDRRWIEVFHDGKWVATARPSVELDAAARARVLERRRADAKELRAWARRARRRASVRVAPITAPGEIEPLDPPAPPADTRPSTGRATLRLRSGLGGANSTSRSTVANNVNSQVAKAVNISGTVSARGGTLERKVTIRRCALRQAEG